MSHVICPMLYVPCHMSHVICHMSYVPCHMSHVICPMSYVTCQMAAYLLERGSTTRGDTGTPGSSTRKSELLVRFDGGIKVTVYGVDTAVGLFVNGVLQI